MIRRLFAIDLRSLAAMRIAIAALALADLVVRATDLSTHYTDGGTLPRVDLLSWYADWHDVPLCLHLLGGSTWSQALLFTIHATFLLAVMFGWRTRLATVGAWLMTASLQLRYPLLVYGADSVFRMVLLWGTLVPLGARWSVDAALARDDEGERRMGDEAGVVRERRDWFGIAAVGLLVQVFAVVFIAGAAKAVTDFWVSGRGLAMALDHEMHTRHLGALLAGFPSLTTALTFLVLGLETVGAILLFAPWWPLRMIALGGLWAMFAGIELSMRVGFFPLATAAALLVFVPGGAWDALESRCGDAWPRWGAEATERCRAFAAALRVKSGFALPASAPLPRFGRLPRLFLEGFAAALLAYVVVWNVGLWQSRDFTPSAAILPFGKTFALWQKWGMFTQFPDTGWFAVPGRLVDGRGVDLFAGRGRLPALDEALAGASTMEERPGHVADQFRNVHWLALFYTMTVDPGEARPFTSYARYLCREWNRDRKGGEALDGFEILYFHRPIEETPRVHPGDEYERAVLWRHRCFG